MSLGTFRRALILSATLAAASAWAQPAAGESARPYGASRPIEGQYIVVFNQRVTNPTALAAQLAAQANAQVLFTYTNTIRGFAGRMSAQAAEGLSRNPNVEYVEQDATVTLSETRIEPPVAQSNATWGIDRIDQRARPLDGQYRYRYTGAGVYAFIVDTGIRPDHVDFGGRVVAGATSITDGRGTDDCDGHGTHVAGTVGGTTWGVAKSVTLVPIRVLDCNGSGSWSGVIAGLDWIVTKKTMRPAVVNMSLGGGRSRSVNASVAKTVDAGVTVIVAAGNSGANACNYSPASEPKAITVGATESGDSRDYYSNFGSCLDIFAPGSSILSTWIESDNSSAVLSGTSMAAPHVAGAVALLLSSQANLTPSQVAQSITSTATGGVVLSAGVNSPNRLLYTMEPPPQMVAVDIGHISGEAQLVRNGWVATFSISVVQSAGVSPVPGATVYGSLSNGVSLFCTTGLSGICSVKSGTLSSTLSSVTFTITNISGAAMIYQSVTSTPSLTLVRPQ